MRARFRLERLEDRCLLSGISGITEFSLPSGSGLFGYPGGITTGPDGNLWFTEMGANAIGMINPTTHAIS
jgi:streptogramin lyase